MGKVCGVSESGSAWKIGSVEGRHGVRCHPELCLAFAVYLFALIRGGCTLKIVYYADAVNASGRRAATLREFADDPVGFLPLLDTRMLEDEEVK